MNIYLFDLDFDFESNSIWNPVPEVVKNNQKQNTINIDFLVKDSHLHKWTGELNFSFSSLIVCDFDGDDIGCTVGFW